MLIIGDSSTNPRPGSSERSVRSERSMGSTPNSSVQLRKSLRPGTNSTSERRLKAFGMVIFRIGDSSVEIPRAEVIQFQASSGVTESRDSKVRTTLLMRGDERLARAAPLRSSLSPRGASRQVRLGFDEKLVRVDSTARICLREGEKAFAFVTRCPLAVRRFGKRRGTKRRASQR